MLKKFVYNDDCIEFYDFVSLALQSDKKLEVFFKDRVINVTGINIYIKYYDSKEAFIGGKVSMLEIIYV